MDENQNYEYQEPQQFTGVPETIPSAKSSNWPKIILGLVGVAVIVILVLYLAGVAPFEKKWQAVFLTNGQVYFGHLKPYLGRSVKLTDIYYLQVSQQLQPTAATSTPAETPGVDIQLVKLGGELHGPSDAMYINRNQVLFWENLKEDSSVVRGIEQLQARR